METLAYLHLALANETPTSSNYTLSISPKNFKLLNWFRQCHLPPSAALRLMAIAVALAIIGMATQASALVKQGDRGSEVTTVQQRLQKLGYFKATATGYYGPITRRAVIRFQRDNGLLPDGIVGTNTQALLDEPFLSDTPEEGETSEKTTWRIGDRGEPVSTIQQKLAEAGLRSGTKGIFDEETQEAVRQFQQEKGLKIDGIVGPQTLAALSQNEINESVPEPAKPDLQNEPTPEPSPNSDWFDNNSAPDTPFIRIPE